MPPRTGGEQGRRPSSRPSWTTRAIAIPSRAWPHQERRRALGTDGPDALLITDPLTGRVQVRPLRVGQIVDRSIPRTRPGSGFHKRESGALASSKTGTLPSTTRTRWETRRAYWRSASLERPRQGRRQHPDPVGQAGPAWRLIASGCGACPAASPAIPWAIAFRDFPVRLGAHRPPRSPGSPGGPGPRPGPHWVRQRLRATPIDAHAGQARSAQA